MDDASLTTGPAWANAFGIDCFAWVTAHENKHQVQFNAFWPSGWLSAQDSDHDLLPDSLEPNYMPGRPYDPTTSTTYPDTVGYGQNPIPDFEDIDMRSQISPYNVDQLWKNGSADVEDWASPGKNTKNRY